MSKPIIQVKSLVKKYNGFTAVDSISFEVNEGEIFAFLGPNGAGKTTTIKMLTTLLKPTSGEMRLNGHDPVKDPDEARKSFGIVFQDPSLDDDLTAWENLEFHGVLYGVPTTERRRKIDEMLKFVGLDDRARDLVSKFSGGMKRRLEIARGLLHQPRILFLDEPTLGLDPQTRTRIWEYICQQNKEQNLTVFFSTHYFEDVEKSVDRVGIIDHGKIIALGTVEELKAQFNQESLEAVFLELTGRDIREQEADRTDRMRAHMRGH